MSRWDLTSGTAEATSARKFSIISPRKLARVVGRALGLTGTRGRAFRGFESLEPRQLLEGNFATATLIALNGQGLGSSAGVINPAQSTTDNDYYQFVMPGANGTSNFVSVLADTRNEGPTGSPLDTRVTIFAASDLVNPIVAGVTNPNANTVTGINNSQLTTGVARDGWGGFIGTAGVTYFVIVSSDSSVGAPVQGSYTLRVRAQSTSFDVDIPLGIGRELGSPEPDLAVPILPTAIVGTIDNLEEDRVFKYVAPTDDTFKGLVTVNAQVTQRNLAIRLDSRLDIYKQSDATGKLTRITFDSDAGRLNDAFATFKAEPGGVYWIRVRSDEVRPTAPSVATGKGSFFLVLDGSATELAMNPVTRRGSDQGGAFIGFDPPTVPPVPAVGPPTFQTASYRFISQGTGLAIITAVPTGLAPVTDPAVRLFDSNGTLIAYNDNFAGLSSQIEAQIVGGNEYFIVVDGFDVNSQIQYQLFVESNHTFSAAQPLDDHANLPGDIASQDPAIRERNRRLLEESTPLVWSNPFITFDGDNNIVRDRGLRQLATGTGRLQGAGDDDMFQFVAPADMLGTYTGDNDDAGTSLFVGGRFEFGDPNVPYPTLSRGLTSYDGGDWWYTGRQDIVGGIQLGFTANTAASGRAEIYAMVDWDSDLTGDPADGTTDHFLIVGGDFTLTILGDAGPVIMTNIAAWGWNPLAAKFQWFDLGSATGGPVRALTVFDPQAYDPDGSRPLAELDDPGDNWIVAGGDFTTIGGVAANRIGFFDDNFTWNAIGNGITGGATPSVRSLAVYDPDDAGDERAASAGPPALTLVNDSPDHPAMLYVGGVFNTAGTVASQNLAAWSGQRAGADQAGVIIGVWNTPNIGSNTTNTKPTWTINGAVNAMTVMDVPDVDGAGPFEGGERLIVAGEFTTIGGQATSTVLPGTYTRIAMFGRKAADTEPNTNTAVNDYRPRLVWDPLLTGITGGPVHALTVWDPVDVNGIDFVPRLAVGGAFTGADGAPAAQLAFWTPNTLDNGGQFWEGQADPGPLLADGVTPGVIRSLTAFTDQQEPQIPLSANFGGTDPQEILYVGGDFASMGGVDANGVAGFGFDQNIPGFTFFSLGQGFAGGVGNQDPNDTTSPTVFALAAYDDGDPFRWDHHDRPATKIAIVVNADFGGFENTFLRIFDSNMELIYENDTIAPPFPDPSGSLDLSLTGPPIGEQQFTVQVPDGIWAGESYYIQISDTNNNGTGRYSFSVVVDGLPPADADLGLPAEVNGAVALEPREGNFATSNHLTTALNSGDTSIAVNSANPPPPFQGRTLRNQIVAPHTPTLIQYASDLGNIQSIDDTDLWNFRAEFTGTVEVRINTREYFDQFGELLTDLTTGQATFNGRTKTISSPLDSALRIFDNDFTQLTYNNDNYAVKGELTLNEFVGVNVTGFADDPQTAVNESNSADFYRRDARVVFNVVAGNVYYIQVESGQRYVDGKPADPDQRVDNIAREIDWRRVSGGYQLYLNQMPNVTTDVENGQTILDDFGPTPVAAFNAGFAAPLVFGDDPTNDATNGVASITGVINNTPNNPIDVDDFTFLAVGSGQSRISVTRLGTGSNLSTQLQFIDTTTGQVTIGAPAGPGVVALTTDLIVGRRYGIRVSGNGGTEGQYRLDIAPVAGPTGAKVRDDFADGSRFWNAQDFTMRDFLGSGSVDGEIEVAGDTDVFRFSVDDFSTFTVSVTPVTPTFNPFVTVYEISEDPLGNPIALRVGFNDNANGNTLASSVTVPVTPNRIIDLPDPQEDRVYPFYYVVVRGSNVDGDTGKYTVGLSFPPTDDHADAAVAQDGITRDTSEYAFATAITVDALTGQGTSSGLIEREGDSDLFIFTTPASGSATVTITRPVDSTIRTRVAILADGAPNSASVTIASSTAPDSSVNGTTTITFNVSRGVRYFIVVEGFGPPNTQTTTTGAYNVAVAAPPIDDYANATEWNLAFPIVISQASGHGIIGGTTAGDPLNARISPNGDTDLFRFTSIANGTYTITVATFDAGSGAFAPRLSVYNASQGLIQQVAATVGGQQITIQLTNVTIGTSFFVLVDAVSGVGAPLNGEYRLDIGGPIPGGGGTGGPDPSIIDFNNPTAIALDPRTGLGQKADLIDIAGDRDLFTFTTFNFSGPFDTFIQVVTPSGSLLDATVRVLQAPNELSPAKKSDNITEAFDADGLPGATASTDVRVLPNHQYWVVVDGVGATVGSYTIRVSTRPASNTLFFPEGWASDSVNSRIAITNPNDVVATYTIIARYEVGSLETIIATGTIDPNGTVRQVISGSANVRPAGLRTDTPFAIVVQSDVSVGATFTHTDFGGSLGESLTETVTPTWNFARVEREPGQNLDFVLFYNPNGFDVDVTLTAYQTGSSPVSITTKVGALRRGGLAINDLPSLPRGVFSVILTSHASDSAFDSSFQGIVASLSHYDLVHAAAFTALGDQGSTALAVPSFTQGSLINSGLVLFNPGSSATTVTLTGSYISAGLPGIARTYDIQPKSQLVLKGQDLSLIADQAIGLRFRSSSAISVLSTQSQKGEMDATVASAEAGTRFFFGDAFINTAGAGNLFFQTLNIHNPTGGVINVNVRLLFTDGTTTLITMPNVPARGFAQVRLHERPEIITNRSGDVLFAIDATSTSPILATLTGYDLTRHVGWTIAGRPFGLTNPIARI